MCSLKGKIIYKWYNHYTCFFVILCCSILSFCDEQSYIQMELKFSKLKKLTMEVIIIMKQK